LSKLRDLLGHLADPVVRRRTLVVVSTLALTSLPLVGGLGYENGFVLAPVFAGLGMAVAIDATRASPPPGGPAFGARVGAIASRIVGELSILWLLAIAMLTLGQLWQPNCDAWGGLAFFGMGPVASSLAGTTAGLWGSAVATRRGRQLGAAIAVMLASTAIAAWRLIADPVVFAYDPFWGYFSGSIYDEAVSVGRTYLTFRVYNALGIVAAVVAWAQLVDPVTLRLRRPRRGHVGAWVITGALCAATGAIGLRAASFGFTANVASITRVLSGRMETEHFVIHFGPRSADAREIDVLAAEHEFAWDRLRRVMGREPEGKVHSFVFANPDQKRALMGAGRVQVAAPWRGQIYLDHRPFPHPVLQHELAHVFGRTVGDGLFGVSRSGLFINIALIEGFATALAPRPNDRLDLHDQVTVLERLKRRPSLESIMGPKFFTQSSRVAYTTAGSFCAWLIETYGFERMGQVYGNAGDFEAVYDKSLGELEQEWLTFLAARPGVTDGDVERQRQLYERRSVFARPCAHRAATLLDEVGAASRAGRWDEAIEGYRTLCEIEPELPEHKLGLAQSQALAGDFDGALAVLAEAETMDALTVTLRAAILERKADVALAAAPPRPAEAGAALEEALSLPMSEDKQRALQLKRMGAEDPRLAPLLTEYFGVFDPELDSTAGAVIRLYAATRMRDEGWPEVGVYLVARQLLNVQRPADAIEPLRLALAQPEALPSPLFVRAARAELVSAYLQTGAYDAAREVLAALDADPDIGNGHRVEYADWRARIEFFAAYRAQTR
jgi:tetratricopeptide (TPR) repeat protein